MENNVIYPDLQLLPLLSSNGIMSDETTWQVNKEPSKLTSSNSFIWGHRTGGCEQKPIILYEYTVADMVSKQENSL
ncbi:MAG: hypothetical protein RR636_06600 [Clostridium sp.]